MFNLIRTYQLDIMLFLCGSCSIMTFLLALTRFLPRSRKAIMIQMELVAFFLLFFDRLAYIYSSNPSRTGYVMVRVSNFAVFFLTPYVVVGFSVFLMDWLQNEGGMKHILKRLRLVAFAGVGGMILSVIAAFSDLYYYFDETNKYHRGRFFLVSYIIPVICPIICLTVVLQYRKKFTKLVYAALLLYVLLPLACGIIQIFTYGISIVNMAMVIVSVIIYILTYLDINNTVAHAHEIEIQNMHGENKRMQKLFDQMATAFVSAVERKDESIKGCSVRVAECAKKIAGLSGMDEQECDKVYYAALLHNVGMIGISDDKIMQAGEKPENLDEILAEMPVIGEEILSNIKEMPYLGTGARYCHEKYDGTGSPEGLKGEDIPEIARIIAVADAYVLMKTDCSLSRDMPDFVVREALLKGEGEIFDPKYAEIMIGIIDEEGRDKPLSETVELEKEITCSDYREQISAGIPVGQEITKVTFSFDPIQNEDGTVFSAPSIILFDSYDNRVHDNERAIEAYKYMEYGEIWFDDHYIQTEARKIQETVKKRGDDLSSAANAYEIRMGRYEDHLKLTMTGPAFEKEVIVALPNGSQSAYIGITGENCRIWDITVERTKEKVKQDDIPKIVEVTSYIDRMESDIKNVQVDRLRSASTGGIELKDDLKIDFHTMSLPDASLVWHCPYIVIFSSDDGEVGGENYREYALVKLCGDKEEDMEFAVNNLIMKKTEEFMGWETWNETNKKGLECEVLLKRKDNRVLLKTKNLGIEMENTTTINGTPGKVFVALTGDQVAITDIRVRQ